MNFLLAEFLRFPCYQIRTGEAEGITGYKASGETPPGQRGDLFYVTTKIKVCVDVLYQRGKISSEKESFLANDTRGKKCSHANSSCRDLLSKEKSKRRSRPHPTPQV